MVTTEKIVKVFSSIEVLASLENDDYVDELILEKQIWEIKKNGC